MNSILEIDQENLIVTEQPGVITLDMINKVESKGLFYPPDPRSMKISTIGWNINESPGGLRGIKYGVIRDYVLALEVVLRIALFVFQELFLPTTLIKTFTYK